MTRAAAVWDAFLLAASVYLYVVAGRYASFAPAGEIGPEFWPRVVLGMMGLAAAVDLALGLAAGRGLIGSSAAGKAVAGAEPGPAAKPTRRGSIAVSAAMLLIVAYVAALPYVGFLLATLVLLASMLWISGYRNVPVILFLSIVSPVFLAFMFERLLQVVFPIGTGICETITIAVYHGLHIF